MNSGHRAVTGKVTLLCLVKVGSEGLADVQWELVMAEGIGGRAEIHTRARCVEHLVWTLVTPCEDLSCPSGVLGRDGICTGVSDI